MKIGRILLLAVAGLGLAGALAIWLAGRGIFGSFDSEDRIPTAGPRSPAAVAALADAQQAAARAVGAPAPARQILFGDLHVHTTISFDAFMLNLPLMGGEGAHPPADACDFARHCAALDFWSINDHASNIHPDDWRNTVESIRACNERSGDPASPDLVSFLGWEWTQVGATARDHYGHKNVVLAHTDDARIPTRPIAASAGGTAARPPPVWARGALALQGGRFHDLALRWTALGELPTCADGDSRSLPPNCREIAPTPVELFRKLDEWGLDAIVIPHGTAWGIYTPPGSTWDKQLEPGFHDPARQTLIEVYSGHGGSEVYRDWQDVESAADGTPGCPEERPDYLPMCRRAGQIVEARCLAAGEPSRECAARAATAREQAAAAGVSPQVTVPGATAADWLDAGQCRDCGQPAFHYRPGSSAQYIASLSGFDGEDEGAPPRRFRMGFIASSDIHTARAGVGYKEARWQTDAGQEPRPDAGGIVGAFLRGAPEEPVARSRSYAEAAAKLSGLQFYETERTQSFLYTGGLVAVHADGRSRDAIWQALRRKEVYGTSGPRILLWFDLLREAGSRPMGSEVTMRDAPAFRVRAVGSLEQRPGCPDEAVQALGAERLQRLCRGECYRPSDTRRTIERIEVVRIRPAIRPGEDVASRIDDPWRSFACPPDPAGCTATFVDDEFPRQARDTVYYARVFEAATPTVNGNPLACTVDDEGRCIATRPCRRGEPCLDAYAQRAWSSPIYVDWPARSARASRALRH